MGHHHVTFADLPQGGEKFEPAKGAKVINALGGLGALGLIGSAFLFFTKTDTFAYSWLFAVFFAFTIVCGAVFWVMLHNASNSGWGVAIRRLWEQLSGLILPLALLSLPLLHSSVQTPLYEWMEHHREAAHHAHESGSSVYEALHHMAEGDEAKGVPGNSHLHVLTAKFGYLNISGWFSWYTRFFAYFLILWFIASKLRGLSVKQDMDGDIKHTVKARQFACTWLLFFALTVTFAAVDWVQTLDYTWFSTMWGVYIFAGCAWSSMAVTIMLVTWLRGLGYLNKVVTEEHYHLMGKLLFAFTVFWAYIAFSQYFLIWYANITEETRFYLTRNTGGWRWVSIFIVVGHFVAPFLALLSQQRKKKAKVMIGICLWVLFMHVIDIYWMIIPERGPSLGVGVVVPTAWIGDVVAFVGVLGSLGFLFLKSLARTSLYPCRDPRLLESANVIN